jgi:adenylate kinase family enzyme
MDIQNPKQKQFIIILGRSGAGKGTQALLLKKVLEEKGYEKVEHITTGGGFRAFNEGGSYAARCAKEINDRGGLQPEFLAIWNWSGIFINLLQGNETVILDGAPRKIDERVALSSAISFFGYTKPIVIHLDAPESWSLERLEERGREDDLKPESTARKMSWFDEQVLPVIEAYTHDPLVHFMHINGKQSIDEVHKEILAKLDSVM